MSDKHTAISISDTVLTNTKLDQDQSLCCTFPTLNTQVIYLNYLASLAP